MMMLLLLMMMINYDDAVHLLPESIVHTANKAGYGRGPKVARRPFAKTWDYVHPESALLMLMLMTIMMLIIYQSPTGR